MDYGKILSRAWQVTWRWKVLWVFGFLASLGNGGGGSGGGSNFSLPGDSPRGPGNMPDFDFSPEIGALLIGLACVVFILMLALWALSIVSRGALIAGVQQVEDEGQTSFGSAWRAGLSRFWTLFGIGVLTALPIIVLVLVIIIGGVAVVAGSGWGVLTDLDSMPERALAVILPTLACLIPLVCLVVILAIVLEQIRIYADRAAMLEGKGWIEAFKRGWEVLRANFGPTVVFWFVFLILGAIFAAIAVGGFMALLLPAVAVFGSSEPSGLGIAAICSGLLILFVIFGLIGAVFQTYTSSTWTLVYRQLTRRVAPA